MFMLFIYIKIICFDRYFFKLPIPGDKQFNCENNTDLARITPLCRGQTYIGLNFALIKE